MIPLVYLFRYGAGVTREVGKDLAFWKSKKVAVFADPNLALLSDPDSPVQVVLQSISDAGVDYELFRFLFFCSEQ